MYSQINFKWEQRASSPLHSWNWFCYWKWNEVFFFLVFFVLYCRLQPCSFACCGFYWLTVWCRLMSVAFVFFRVRNSRKMSLWKVAVISTWWFIVFQKKAPIPPFLGRQELSSHEIACITVFKSNLVLSAFQRTFQSTLLLMSALSPSAKTCAVQWAGFYCRFGRSF